MLEDDQAAASAGAVERNTCFVDKLHRFDAFEHGLKRLRVARQIVMVPALAVTPGR